MIPEAALTSFVAALFSMMNPIGSVGVFAGMTADRPEDEARRIAWTCADAIAITLLIVVEGVEGREGRGTQGVEGSDPAK